MKTKRLLNAILFVGGIVLLSNPVWWAVLTAATKITPATGLAVSQERSQPVEPAASQGN